MWVFYLGSVGLILFLYGVKVIVLRWVRGAATARITFAVAAGLCVPVTWALSPDWHNLHVYHIANFVGNPIATLFVPCVSFLIDLARRSGGKEGCWYWRIPLELFVGVPAWFFLWIFVELFVLGWAWM
jgi:hypothetical protein